MQMQMKYVMPFFVALIAYTTSGAVALYLFVNSLISIVQEMFIRKKIKKAGTLAAIKTV